MSQPFSRAFSVTVPGKWVLAGEHSVIRGCPAVALPHPEFSLTLTFTPTSAPILVTEPEVLKTVMDPLLEKALRLRGISTECRPRGLLSIQSSIPLGSGLGSSAALCVATARWLAEVFDIQNAELQRFATELEDSFHGKSSGMDVATCLAEAPILFTRGAPANAVFIKQLPNFKFFDTGYRCSTRECILKVEDWIKANAALAFEVDQKMARASELAHQGLSENDTRKIIQSMDLSWECYRTWGWIPPQAEAMREKLLSEGAAAVRLTGAGLGGYCVAFYPER